MTAAAFTSLLGYMLVCSFTPGSAACLTWTFLGIKLQKIYFKYFRPINAVLGMFLLYCAFAIMKG